MVRTYPKRFAGSRCAAGLAVLVAAALSGAAPAAAQTFDGITIIRFSDEGGKRAIADGDHIVTFVSARGSYGAVVAPRGSHAGCQALAVQGSYTGASIGFGMAVDPVVARQLQLKTYCPVFSMQFEDAETVRITVPDYYGPGKNYETSQKVVAHIPFHSVDFESEPFTRHDIKGVRIGPLLETQGLSGLGGSSGGSDRHRFLTRQVTTMQGKETALQGRAAAAEITGWPWDVLYFANYSENFGAASTFDAFKEAVVERYGQPSSIYDESGFMLWLYDLDGRKLGIGDPDPSGCRATAEFWMQADPLKRVTGMGWDFGGSDIGPWGCSLVMNLSPDRSSGGVRGYWVQVGSGYVMAMNHFLQRIEQTTGLLDEVRTLTRSLRTNKPKF